MHSLRSMRKLAAGLGLAAFSVALVPAPAHAALPLPGVKQTFRLFSRAISFINVNRIYCGMNVNGNSCVDSAGRGTVQGGFWPRGSSDNYVFNSGLQIAGVIQGAKSAANPWGGDTTGGWWFDGAGGRVQTEGFAGAAAPGCAANAQIYQSFNSADAACWPLDAYVPKGDFVEDVYAEPLRGLVAASQGDVHWLSWEGNPALNRVRLHPLGILVDYRFLAWNYPAGAQDVLFLVATFYNITSSNPADYAQHRPGIRDVLVNAGVKFQQLNNAAFGITLPAGGYTIGPAFVAFAADNDVGNENNNYNGGILPFAMGYTYDGQFGGGKAGWTFDPAIFAPPFFKGVGFIGMKYLRGPQGTADDPKGKIQLLSTFCNGNCNGTPNHSDPGSTIQNFRQMSGHPGPNDSQCDIPGDPAVNHICFMVFGPTNGTDTRIFESSDSMTLKPGDGKVIVAAYIFAAPVAIPGFVPAPTGGYDPGDLTWSSHPDSMILHNGLNKVDSLSGFVHYNGIQREPDGSEHVPTQLDFSVVKGSLLDKALVAQAVFDVHFLQEFAPDAPPFFLIPGDKQVTILWKPSPTETTGDPFFQVVGNPLKTVNGVQIVNPLYDPNYRKFDVEGYRIYRGRSDTPTALKLLVQYDYAGTTFKDFTGVVANGNCAPELGIATDCPATSPAGGLPTAVTPTPAGLGPAPAPGTAFTRSVTYNIGPQTGTVGSLIATNPLVFCDFVSGTCGRKALAGGTTTLMLVTDTTVAGGNSGFPPLADTGVPFIFIDKVGNCGLCGVNNGVTYFYSVTAFDVNAPGHGPTSLESAKITKQVTPQAPASNFSNAATTQSGIFGRGANPLTDNVVPTIDTLGRFSKKFPPTNAVTLALAGFAPQLLKGAGSVGVQYDSTQLTAIASAGNASIRDWFTGIGTSGNVVVSLPFAVPYSTNLATPTGLTGTFTALSVDSTIAAIYGGGAGYTIAGAFTVNRPGGYWTGNQGRGCVNGVYGAISSARPGQCYFSGPRWFIGDNETNNPETAAPLSFVNDGAGAGIPGANYNNAGETSLTGVVTAFFAQANSYFINAPWRDIDNSVSTFVTAADYKLYWGAAGAVDSVIDVTHDTPVPFKPTVGASWGFLNSSGAPANAGGDARPEITAVDIQCVPPLRNFSVSNPAPACTQTYAFENTAKPGPIAFFNGAPANAHTAPAAANAGFMLYIKGRIFIFELAGGALPAAGTVWTERDLVGIVYGGKGPAADLGPYAYVPSPLRPFTAPGSSAKFSFNVTNELLTADAAAVAKVHTVPDPYYVTSAFDLAVNSKDIQFVNVPVNATIRIYTTSGVLIRVLQNTSTTFGGIVHWDVRNRTNQFVSSGVYFYNVEAGSVNQTGRMTIVNYASTVQ